MVNVSLTLREAKRLHGRLTDLDNARAFSSPMAKSNR